MVKDEIDQRRFEWVRDGGLAARDCRPDDGEDAGADDRADAERRERPRPEGFLQLVFRILGIRDQLVDGLAAQ